MSDGMYTAGAGMVARQVWQTAASDNLANVSTPGYKATRIFSDELNAIRSADSLRGVAARQHAFTDFSQGVVEDTGRDLDVALQGDGFFVVQTARGERYTRNGNFALDAAGTLVDASGAPVLSDSGPITLSGGRIEVDAGGLILVDGVAAGQLALKHFEVRDALVREGNSHFAPRPGAAPVPPPAATTVRQRALERSNADGLDEMVRMTSVLREYEAAQRMVRLQSDALARTVNELIQR